MTYKFDEVFSLRCYDPLSHYARYDGCERREKTYESENKNSATWLADVKESCDKIRMRTSFYLQSLTFFVVGPLGRCEPYQIEQCCEGPR